MTGYEGQSNCPAHSKIATARKDGHRKVQAQRHHKKGRTNNKKITIMEARDFYDKRIKEDPSIGSVKLMEEYAKHIIEINFCDGSPIDFDELSIKDLKKVQGNINLMIDWVNS